MKSRLPFLLLVLLWLLPAPIIADEAQWTQHMRAATAADQRGDYEEALSQSKQALKFAEELGELDPRVTVSSASEKNV